MTMTRPEPVEGLDVLVAIPARNEEASIDACLAAVVAAARVALAAPTVRRVRIAVAAHRCRDLTAFRASAALAASGLDHVVVDDLTSTTVGAVRTRLVGRAMRVDPPLEPARTWVLSTDADSTVPTDWVVGLLGTAERTGADLVAGLVGLDDWHADPAAVAAYDRLLLDGLRPDGHSHVWAANLAVSFPAFLAAGGFPSVEHGEEHGLVERVASRGRVVGALSPVVTTSARMPGRAAHGLGDLLRRLTEDVATAS